MENELNRAKPDERDSGLPEIEAEPGSFDPPGSEDDSEPEIASPDFGDAGPEVEPVAEPEPVEPPSPVVADRGGVTPAVVGANPLVLGLTIALVFVIGLLMGFFGRPVIIEDLPIEVVVTVVPDQSQAVAQNTTQSAAPGQDNANAAGGQANQQPAGDVAPGEPTPTIMDFVMSDARHIQGDEAAPITIVEFSDFN